jgi:hypothetical protein
MNFSRGTGALKPMKIVRIKSYLLCLTLAWTASVFGVLEAVGERQENRDIYRFKSVKQGATVSNVIIRLVNSEDQKDKIKVQIPDIFAVGEDIVDGICMRRNCIFAALNLGGEVSAIEVKRNERSGRVERVERRQANGDDLRFFSSLRSDNNARASVNRLNAGKNSSKKNPTRPDKDSPNNGTDLKDNQQLYFRERFNCYSNQRQFCGPDNLNQTWCCPRSKTDLTITCGASFPECKQTTPGPIPASPDKPTNPEPPTNPSSGCKFKYSCQYGNGLKGTGEIECKSGNVSVAGHWGSVNCADCKKSFNQGCSEGEVPPSDGSTARDPVGIQPVPPAPVKPPAPPIIYLPPPQSPSCLNGRCKFPR